MHIKAGSLIKLRLRGFLQRRLNKLGDLMLTGKEKSSDNPDEDEGGEIGISFDVFCEDIARLSGQFSR